MYANMGVTAETRAAKPKYEVGNAAITIEILMNWC